MMAISRVLAVPTVGAGYHDDLAALHNRYVPPAQRFTSDPLTPGFRAVREVAEALSVGLVLEDGQVAWGDCLSVAYSGMAGRDPVFRAARGTSAIQRVVAPTLQGRSLTSFRELAAEVDALSEPMEVPGEQLTKPRMAHEDGLSRRSLLTAPARALGWAREQEEPAEGVVVQRRLNAAIRYGVSQALLQATALAEGLTMAQVIAEEWGLPVPDVAIPIHAQSGSERYYSAERMIARRVASLPQALIEDIPDQLGTDGAELTRYIRWLRERIGLLGGASYQPAIHLDVHGALGQIYDNDLGRILGQLYAWELAAKPYQLRIESPVVLETREAQIEAMRTLCAYVRRRKMGVELVADEWANTLEDIRAFAEAGAAHMIQVKTPDLGSIHNSIDAVLACKLAGIGTFVGGSYAETDISARVSVHVALATRPDMLMAKPGLGVDEAISLAHNEMARALALINDGRDSVRALKDA